MQIRLDPPNAAAVRKDALAHRRIFKRKRSFADVVNRIVGAYFDRAKNNAKDAVWTPAGNMGDMEWRNKL